MGLKGLTINTDPAAEPHIYAEDDAAIFESIFGTDGVLTLGSQFEASVLSNNNVRVSDGIACIGGHIGRTPYGEYDDVEITNGQSGVNRNDIIICRFVSTGSGGIDDITLEVKEGTAAAEAVDPDITQENLYEGGLTRELPLYRVRIEGLSIVAVEPLFTIVPTIPELKEEIDELNSELENVEATLDATNNTVSGLKNTFSRFTTVGSSGYIKMPNGLNMCYGYCLANTLTADSGSGGYATTITLPITLRSPVVVMVAPVFTSGFPRCSAYAISVSKIKLMCDVNVSGCTLHWIAIG